MLDSSANIKSRIYWLASYPKSGNTWFRFFLCNYLQNKEIPADINKWELGIMASARSWIDEALGFDSSELSEDEVEQLRPEVYRWSGRSNEISYHKIHDAYTYLSDNEPLVCREATRGAIYILRNPLDLAVSYAPYYNCTIDQAIEYMGQNLYISSSKNKYLGPQVRQRLMSWSKHVASWVDAQDLKIEVIRYEDMKAAPMETFSRAIGFLDLPVNQERIAKAIRFCEFNELKAQEVEKGFKDRPIQTQEFFRKGIVGDWKNVLSDAQARKIISDHRDLMLRFGYLNEQDNPLA